MIRSFVIFIFGAAIGLLLAAAVFQVDDVVETALIAGMGGLAFVIFDFRVLRKTEKGRKTGSNPLAYFVKVLLLAIGIILIPLFTLICYMPP